MDKVREDIIDVLALYTHVPKAQIEEGMGLEDELGIGGADLDLVLYDIEVKRGIDFEGDVPNIETVGDLIEIVKEKEAI
jgi:hypothetical protein